MTIVTLNSNGAYWQASWQTAAGKRARQSIGPKSEMTRKQAQAECRRLEEGLAAGIRPDQVPTLAAWLDRWIANRTDLSAGTRGLYALTKRYLLAHFAPTAAIDTIDRSQAADWRAAMSRGELSVAHRQRRHRKPPADATVCQHTRNAKTIFAAAVDEDVIAKNPFAKLRSNAAAPEKSWAVVDDSAAAALMAAATNTGWRLLIALCYYAGLRRHEALALRWEHVIWDANRLHVRPEKIDTKHSRRDVYLEPALKTILTAAYMTAEKQTIVPPADFSLSNYYVHVRRIFRLAGLTIWTKPLHTLRKARATAWRRDRPEHVVDAWLGHGPEVARKHYSRVDEHYYADTAHDATMQAVIEVATKTATNDGSLEESANAKR